MAIFIPSNLNCETTRNVDALIPQNTCFPLHSPFLSNITLWTFNKETWEKKGSMGNFNPVIGSMLQTVWKLELCFKGKSVFSPHSISYFRDDIYLTFITSESQQRVREISTGKPGKSLKYSFRTGRKLRKRNFLKSSVMAINNNETIMRALKLSKSQFLGRGASVFSTILTK